MRRRFTRNRPKAAVAALARMLEREKGPVPFLSCSLENGVLSLRVNFRFWVKALPKEDPPPLLLHSMPRRRTAGARLMDAPALYAEHSAKPPPPVPDDSGTGKTLISAATTLDAPAETLPGDDEPSRTNLRQQRAQVRHQLRVAMR